MPTCSGWVVSSCGILRRWPNGSVMWFLITSTKFTEPIDSLVYAFWSYVTHLFFNTNVVVSIPLKPSLSWKMWNIFPLVVWRPDGDVHIYLGSLILYAVKIWAKSLTPIFLPLPLRDCLPELWFGGRRAVEKKVLENERTCILRRFPSD